MKRILNILLLLVLLCGCSINNDKSDVLPEASEISSSEAIASESSVVSSDNESDAASSETEVKKEIPLYTQMNELATLDHNMRDYTFGAQIQHGEDIVEWDNPGITLYKADGEILFFGFASFMIESGNETVDSAFYISIDGSRKFYQDENEMFFLFDGVGYNNVMTCNIFKFDFVTNSLQGYRRYQGYNGDDCFVQKERIIYIYSKDPNSSNVEIRMAVIDRETMKELHNMTVLEYQMDDPAIRNIGIAMLDDNTILLTYIYNGEQISKEIDIS